MKNLTKLVTNKGDQHHGKRDNEKDKDHGWKKMSFILISIQNSPLYSWYSTQYCTALQMKGWWESNIKVWFPEMKLHGLVIVKTEL